MECLDCSLMIKKSFEQTRIMVGNCRNQQTQTKYKIQFN